MRKRIVVIACVAALASCRGVAPANLSIAPDSEHVVSTEVLGPFTGADAPLHPDNTGLAYYGTDLGFSYRHGDRIQFLFGDTWATEAYAPIDQSNGARNDDSFGYVALSEWPDSSLISPDNLPRLRMGQYANRDMQAIINGFAMDLGKTPMAGFSNGAREFAIFNLTKPQGCDTNAQCGALSCDAGLGYVGVPFTQEESLTGACPDGAFYCTAATIADHADSGFCSDPGSSIWASTPAGRTAATAMRVRIGARDRNDPRLYTDNVDWLTTRFLNVAARSVTHFEPDAPPSRQDYRSVTGVGAGQRVFLWGRPGFVGVAARGRPLALYFAYVDMPGTHGLTWRPHFYAGLDANGAPRFSENEADAQALDLDHAQAGVQSQERYDVVNQMSVVWVERLNKWVMFYGGGMGTQPTAALPLCGILQWFAGPECGDVEVGNGAIRMRMADNPWGPWSAPEDVLVGGMPNVASEQYAPGGMLHSAACGGAGCAPHSRTPFYAENEYGFLYGANIIEEWTRETDDGVELIWNASTWDPYRVALFRTRLRQ